MPGGALGHESLERLLAGPSPLVGELRDRDGQVQPNGVDLTVERIWELTSAGAIGGPAPGRRLPDRVPRDPAADGWYHLEPGAYVVLLHEWVRLPTNLMGLSRPRSTLLRCGALVHTAVWDAGYAGRPEALLVVANPHGLDLAPDAAICQLVFFTLTEEVEGYRGAYQGQ